ncbi:MAG TPA: hypothetical protein VFV75_16860 [Candidatus Polarisedimenticolaceae bacterium]|nr:hypothetical protein [Candidatus Polarisedimenticolaceae bacterium]
MTYFPDLSPYAYDPLPGFEGRLILNVGWLSFQHPFYRRGWTSRAFRLELRRLCEDTTIRHRGYHHCSLDLCVLLGFVSGDGIVVTRSGSSWFAAPSLVYHYVRWHLYRPPDDFIESVLSTAQPPSGPAGVQPCC